MAEPLIGAIPPPEPDDDEDVVWALTTASTMWKRGDKDEAIRWVKRAAEHAADTENDDRALALGKLVAELASRGVAAKSPPASEPAAGAKRAKTGATGKHVAIRDVPASMKTGAPAVRGATGKHKALGASAAGNVLAPARAPEASASPPRAMSPSSPSMRPPMSGPTSSSAGPRPSPNTPPARPGAPSAPSGQLPSRPSIAPTPVGAKSAFPPPPPATRSVLPPAQSTPGQRSALPSASPSRGAAYPPPRVPADFEHAGSDDDKTRPAVQLPSKRPPSGATDTSPTVSVERDDETSIQVAPAPTAMPSQCVRVFVTTEGGASRIALAGQGEATPQGAFEALLVATSPSLDLVALLAQRG